MSENPYAPPTTPEAPTRAPPTALAEALCVRHPALAEEIRAVAAAGDQGPFPVRAGSPLAALARGVLFWALLTAAMWLFKHVNPSP